jgi:serine/threonine-protein phosphatase PP1 catalytic subunit
LCDLLWSDPKDGIFGFCDNKERGISFEFGDDIIQKFLKNHKFELIIRGHIMAK